MTRRVPSCVFAVWLIGSSCHAPPKETNDAGSELAEDTGSDEGASSDAAAATPDFVPPDEECLYLNLDAVAFEDTSLFICHVCAYSSGCVSRNDNEWGYWLNDDGPFWENWHIACRGDRGEECAQTACERLLDGC